MDRRNFLKSVALLGTATSIKEVEAMTRLSQNFKTNDPSLNYDMVAIMGGEPEVMFRKAIEELGGMKNFIKKGDKVAVKPDISWDKTPELAANTNPKLVAEIVKQCFDAGAKEVTVFDHTYDDWRKCYSNSGIEAAAKAAGAKVVPAHLAIYYKDISLPKGKILKEAGIHQAIVDADKWINVPVLKNHGSARLSISMKNYMGIVWDRGYFHANDLQQCIADVCTYAKKPVLNVVDAYRVMKTYGPKGNSSADVVLSKGLFISQDIVAVDTAATNFFNQIREMPVELVSHISKAQQLGVGTMQLDKLNIKRVKI